MNASVRPFWPPLAAGVALGATLFATFLVTGHGLGASGSFTGATAWLGDKIAPGAAHENGYLGPMLSGNPLAGWISWELLGVLLGALLAAITSGRFRVRVDGPTRLSGGRRLALALAGGVLSGFGARLARGCTSGLGLSGGAPLAVAAFLFLIGFFVVGVAAGYLMRRTWA
ncbi:MAG: YeeE/YedE family protein [Hyphomicrobiales bacterium]|nr:YeeE/YedE family protein [Hyphomicrobiales bacterium]